MRNIIHGSRRFLLRLWRWYIRWEPLVPLFPSEEMEWINSYPVVLNRWIPPDEIILIEDTHLGMHPDTFEDLTGKRYFPPKPEGPVTKWSR